MLILFHVQLHKAEVHSFIIEVLIGADPDLDVIRGREGEGHVEPRRRVEGAAGRSAAHTVPQCSIVRTITEIVIANK